MTPATFPEANANFCHPPDLEESQCATIPAFHGTVEGGSVDGARIVIVAWKPTDAELVAMLHGEPVFITMLGGLAPHFVTTNFQAAKTVA